VRDQLLVTCRRDGPGCNSHEPHRVSGGSFLEGLNKEKWREEGPILRTGVIGTRSGVSEAPRMHHQLGQRPFGLEAPE
jgi:hypothetical protein